MFLSIMKRLLFLIIVSCVVFGCVEDDSVGPYYASTVTTTTELLIYGGRDADIYLGILNASKYRSESIWNQFGTYGSRYSSKSIWNQYGDYGSEYSNFSPFNRYATYPPELRDSKGAFYGYFTCSMTKSNRARYSLVDEICEHYAEIREDVSGWYDKLFY